ncbi:MAG: hypothetical protein H6828_15455 [Planctomycetes bacterium]|nr:hypothetical protein [Planctomycetota bacterium]
MNGALARHLLPVLLHRANNAAQLMTALSSLARCGPAPSGLSWLEERANDLAQASHDVDELGYLLAVLASASGADLMLERREPRGLAWTTHAVGEALRRDERVLAPASHPVPDQLPVHGGWELCWAAGSLLLVAGRAGAPGDVLEWQWLDEGTSWVLVGACAAPQAVEPLRAALAERCPESVLDVRGGGWSWRVPAAWLRARA